MPMQIRDCYFPVYVTQFDCVCRPPDTIHAIQAEQRIGEKNQLMR
jgi:hypothetical protein